MRPNFKNIDIANEAFNVQHKPLELAEPWKNAELLDITGRHLLTTSNNQMDISDFSNGVYILYITTANGISVKKILKR